eukprot:Nitzschia sp. Nitz4//scaffold89_size161592//33476//33741//NITZ4_002365-RA/size161592-est2genome-gene-0.243-mRNA-1//1//CDS//3329559577//3936//frame0
MLAKVAWWTFEGQKRNWQVWKWLLSSCDCDCDCDCDCHTGVGVTGVEDDRGVFEGGVRVVSTALTELVLWVFWVLLLLLTL